MLSYVFPSSHIINIINHRRWVRKIQKKKKKKNRWSRRFIRSLLQYRCMCLSFGTNECSSVILHRLRHKRHGVEALNLFRFPKLSFFSCYVVCVSFSSSLQPAPHDSHDNVYDPVHTIYTVSQLGLCALYFCSILFRSRVGRKCLLH